MYKEKCTNWGQLDYKLYLPEQRNKQFHQNLIEITLLVENIVIRVVATV